MSEFDGVYVPFGQRDPTDTSDAEVTEAEEENEDGRMQSCVYAVCMVSGDEVGPIWGTGGPSIRRVLLELTKECSCEAEWHRDPDMEDD